MNIKIGCIADDFTGASDAASFLAQGGLCTLLCSGIPDAEIKIAADAVVIALKTRTQETKEAVRVSLAAADYLKQKGAKQLYVKYCSTFDSTRGGNIGPILDALLKRFEVPYTLLCPSLPVNGRTVKKGILYVNGVPLAKSPMRSHPLTPMWDSDLTKLMGAQSRYPSYVLSGSLHGRTRECIREQAEMIRRGQEHFYMIPDYDKDSDATDIVEAFGTLPILSGGSGLLKPLAERLSEKLTKECAETGKKEPDLLKAKALSVGNETKNEAANETKTLLLSGSCSEATLMQVEHYRRHGGRSVKIDPVRLYRGDGYIDELKENILTNRSGTILLYSSAAAEEVREAQRFGREKIAGLLERAMADLAACAAAFGYTGIIVAGGETSGAVTKRLGYRVYRIGRSVAPGVPVMIPEHNTGMCLVLKSGNFGQEDFFSRAVRMCAQRGSATGP